MNFKPLNQNIIGKRIMKSQDNKTLCPGNRDEDFLAECGVISRYII